MAIILDQIKKDGLGSELVIEEENEKGLVRVENLAAWLFTQRAGFRFISFLASKFSSVELLEQVSDFYKLRVPMEDEKTIGFLFG